MQKYEFTLGRETNYEENWVASIKVTVFYAGWPGKSLNAWPYPTWKWAAYLTLTENHPLFEKDADFWHDCCHGGCTFFETSETKSFNTYGSSYEGSEFGKPYKYRVIGMDFSHLGDDFDCDPEVGIPGYIEYCAKALFDAIEPNPNRCEGLYENR
ncbi:TPA: hypothetical protein ACOA2N_003429 [Vibrio cholerae]